MGFQIYSFPLKPKKTYFSQNIGKYIYQKVNLINKNQQNL